MRERCDRPIARSFDEFCALLAHWRIRVSDAEQARRLYLSIGYTHLVPYLDFLRFGTGSMRGAFRTVDHLCALVALDAEIRSAIVENTTIIELQLKTQYAQAMLLEYGEHGIEDPKNYRHTHQQSRIVQFARTGHRRHAQSNLRSMPNGFSGWPSAELASMGEIVTLLGDTRSSRVRQHVADSFSANNRCLVDWLRCLVAVRNACAHANAYCVLARIPRVPKPISGFGESDPTRPLYALALIERLLEGRSMAGIPGAKEDLFRFTGKTSMLLGEFAQVYPDLARGLAIPKTFLALEGKLPLANAPTPQGTPATCYRAIRLSA